MVDSVKITNLPDSGSPERVAFDLWAYLRVQLPHKDGTAAIEINLALYQQCLTAVRGGRYDIGKLG